MPFTPTTTYSFYTRSNVNFLQGVYVTHVDQNSPAERSGIRVGDKILEVNGRDFVS